MTKLITILLSAFLINSCVCYNNLLTDYNLDYLDLSNPNWKQLSMEVKYKDKDRRELLYHARDWLVSNFYFKNDSENAKDENLYFSDKVIESFDENNFNIRIKGIRKENLNRIYECRAILDVSEDKVSIIYYDFVMYRSYSREPYTLYNECTFFLIQNELRELTNEFFYSKFDTKLSTQ